MLQTFKQRTAVEYLGKFFVILDDHIYKYQHESITNVRKVEARSVLMIKNLSQHQNLTCKGFLSGFRFPMVAKSVGKFRNSQRARETAVERYSLEHVVRITEQIILEAVRKKLSAN